MHRAAVSLAPLVPNPPLHGASCRSSSIREPTAARAFAIDRICNFVPTETRNELLEAAAERLANFERHFESIAHPFEWKFTRADLNALIARMRNRWAQSQPLKLAA